MSRATVTGVTVPVIAAPLRVEKRALATASAEVRRTGMGFARSRRAAAALHGRPTLVAGVAGGIAAEVKPGDVVVATEVRGDDGTVVACPSSALLVGDLRRLGLTVHHGPIASQRKLSAVTRPKLRAEGVLAVDMESAWLAPPGQPFAVVRVITDTEDAPIWHPGILGRGLRGLRTLRRAVPALDAWIDSIGTHPVALASPRSFCAGVERAIDIVDRALDRFGAPVYVRREIVHNAHVVAGLKQRGAVFVQEAEEVPEGSVLVLAAHGVAPSVRATAADRSLRVIDATCPLVAKVHTEVKRYAARGDTVFLIGHEGHEEVEGTVGEAPTRIKVIGDVHDAAATLVDSPNRVAFAMQTTLAVDEAEEIAAVLRSRFPALAGPRREDICYATTNRQQAVRAIVPDCDVLLVVGSGNSSNSIRLVEVAARDGVAAHLVEDVFSVSLAWLAGGRRIGITAGASAPPELVDQLIAAIAGLGPAPIREVVAQPEDVHFTLPKEVS